MNLTVIDLEMNQPSGNIIQIGAVVGNVESGEILDHVSIYVRLPEGEKLEERIKILTGITQEQVDNGMELYDAYCLLKYMHEINKCFLNPVTWGGGDSQEILKQLKDKYPNPGKWCFGRRWLDVKTVYTCLRMGKGESPRSGLSKSMNRMGLQFKGSKHNALDDAYNTFRIMLKLISDKDALPFAHLHMGSKS